MADSVAGKGVQAMPKTVGTILHWLGEVRTDRVGDGRKGYHLSVDRGVCTRGARGDPYDPIYTLVKASMAIYKSRFLPI